MRRLVAVAATLAAILAVTVTLALSGGANGRPTAVTLTLYSGQHPQTRVRARRRRSRSRPGIHGRRSARTTRASLAAQIIQEGSHSPGRRLLHRELAAARGARRARAARAASTPRRSPKTSAKYSSPREGLGRRLGPREHDGLQHEQAEAVAAAALGARPRRARSGRASSRSPRPRPTSSRSSPRSRRATARRAPSQVARRRSSANASGHIYPDNETLVAQVNSGQAQLGVINHYYWYRLRDELGASKITRPSTSSRPAIPGYVIDVSGAGVLASSTHQAEAQKFLAFLVSQAGAGDHRPRRELRVPARLGRRHAPSRSCPFATLRPDPITVEQLGDGAARDRAAAPGQPAVEQIG